ncbi:MAG: hypothetical protein WHS45_12995 [Anaerolinea sp.]|nr:hypothetical protein [Anaerolinea thermophila]
MTTITGLRLPVKPFWAVFHGSAASFHLQQNAGAYVPRQSMPAEVAANIRAIFNAADRKTAQEHLQRVI